ncbi:MAG: hypothetical protein QME74_11645, partial [Candidatus Edwardsbacteria bacterium]|nr:hypothetical protein [Candidatus Edwardsbacteria bacterium]
PALIVGKGQLDRGDWIAQDSLKFLMDVGLVQNVTAYPSPFSPNGDERDDACEIGYWLTNPALVSLNIGTIANNAWQPVKTLCDMAYQNPGRNELEWNGRDQAGNVVPDGVYYYRLQPWFADPASPSTPLGASFEVTGQILVDASAPEILSLSPATGDTFRTTNRPALRAVIKAREGDLALRGNMTLKLDGYEVPAVITRDNDSIYTAMFTPSTSIGSGTHIVIAYAADNAGNEGTPVSHAFEALIPGGDDIRPQIRWLKPSDSSIVYNATPPIEAQLFDSASGIDPEMIELVVDGEQVINQVQTLSIKQPYGEGLVDDAGKDYWTEQWLFTKNYLLYNPHTGYLRYNPSMPFANNTYHYVELRARDKAGTCAIEQRSWFKVIVDSVPPQIALLAPANGSFSYKRVPKITAYLSDLSLPSSKVYPLKPGKILGAGWALGEG